MSKILDSNFYKSDVLDVAPQLLGKVLTRKFPDGVEFRDVITEVEAYRGEEDLACHASKGRTQRTEVMFWEGGHVYVYFIYGMYWLLNFVTGEMNVPQAVLIRGTENVTGPGRLGKILKLDKTFYGESLVHSERLWIEEIPFKNTPQFRTTPRIGINYAGDWKDKPWRFILKKTV